MSQDLQSLSKKELVELAKRQGIKGPQALTKAQLINCLSRGSNVVEEQSRAEQLRAFEEVRRERVGQSEGQEVAPQTTATQPVIFPPSEPAPSYAPQPDFPYSYDKTKLVLMLRDPYWAFSYWDIDQAQQKRIDEIFASSWGTTRPVLRVYDITGVSFTGFNSRRMWDIAVQLEARNWYIHLGLPNCSYVVDLGLIDKDGRFHLVARSNVVKTPRDGPSDVIDEEWMCADFEEIYALSGGLGIGLSSGELREKVKRLFKFQEFLSSGGWSGSIPPRKKELEREFLLEAYTELILYGRTKPDAELTVQGQVIKLRPDGTFTLRYALPDGKKALPIHATSADKQDSRSITFQVEKGTL